MICGTCGRQNPAGARYCIHCGAEQSVPTQIAAVAAASSASLRAARSQAANAAHAEPAIVMATHAANQPSAAGEPSPRALEAARAAPPEAPAYAARPRRAGLAAALVVLCVGVGIAAVAGWYWQGGGAGRNASIMAGYVGKDRDARGADESVAPEAAPDADTGAATSSPAGAASAAPDAARAPSDQASAVEGGAASSTAPVEPAPIEIRQLPARPAPSRAQRHPVPEKSAPATPPARQEARPSAPPLTAPTTVAATGAVPVVDRWVRMNDDLSRCTREDFIARVICSQRVRFRYCDGYWGKVAQCPASPAPERGQ